MDLRVIPNTAEMIRDGGSFYCDLRNDQSQPFTLIFPINDEVLIGILKKHSRFDGKRYLDEIDRDPYLAEIYKDPVLYLGPWNDDSDTKNISWKQAFDHLVKTNPKEHKYTDFLGDADYPPMIIDYMAEMIEVARRNMARVGD